MVVLISRKAKGKAWKWPQPKRQQGCAHVATSETCRMQEWQPHHSPPWATCVAPEPLLAHAWCWEPLDRVQAQAPLLAQIQSL